MGDKQQYNLANPDDGEPTCYAVNVIRSIRWPGALTVAKGGKFLNFYLGFGMKRIDSSYQPTEPPEVQQDPDETDMQDEPTPKEAPEELPEEDTDKDEEKEDDE
jgi:radial spoke head protein 4A